MRIKLANTETYGHERLIRILSEVMHQRADAVAAEFIEMGAILLTMMSLDKLDQLGAQLELMRAQGKLRELEPLLLEIRQAWAAGILADPLVRRLVP